MDPQGEGQNRDVALSREQYQWLHAAIGEWCHN